MKPTGEIPTSGTELTSDGLSKREQIATTLLAALLGKRDSYANLVNRAVNLTDELLERLAQTEPE